MKQIVVIIGLAFFASCATAYQSRSLTGGYSDYKISSDSFSVSFEGNAYTALDVAQKYTLYRCAEVTKKNGYRYFEITNRETKIMGTEDMHCPYLTYTIRTYVSQPAGNGNTYLADDVLSSMAGVK